MSESKIEQLVNKEIKSLFIKKETIKALQSLVLKLEKNLPNYDTILSDEASGRLVSLMFEKIINQKRKEQNKERANTFFVTSGQHGDPELWNSLDKFIRERKSALGKTLLATEYIESGTSIMSLIEILEKNGVDFDIAAISIDNPPNEYNDKLINHLYYGKVGKEGLAFYGKPTYAGVTKYSEKLKNPPHPDVFEKKDPKLMKIARNDMKILANEFLKILD